MKTVVIRRQDELPAKGRFYLPSWDKHGPRATAFAYLTRTDGGAHVEQGDTTYRRETIHLARRSGKQKDHNALCSTGSFHEERVTHTSGVTCPHCLKILIDRGEVIDRTEKKPF